MKTRLPLYLFLGTLAAGLALIMGSYVVLADEPAATVAPTDSAPHYPEFSTFQILIDRNIFNAKRKQDASAQPVEEEVATPSPESIVLIGTVIRGAEARALFEGGSEAPSDGAVAGDSLAGYRLSEVRIDGVALTNGTDTIQIPVGAGLAKQADGSWKPIDTPVVAPAPDTSTETTVEEPPRPARRSKDSAADRLRERRRKELGS